MNNTERYLHQATRGLFGKDRTVVRAELEGTIRVRVSDLMLQGLTESDALEKTLEEMGNPKIVSSGMASVYVLPNLGRWFTVFALALGLTIFYARAEVGVVQAKETIEFLGKFPDLLITEGENLLNLNELKIEIENLGGRVGKENEFTKKFEAGDLKDHPDVLWWRLPEFKQAYPFPVVTQDGIRYVSMGWFTNMLGVEKNLDVSVQGWSVVTLKIGNKTMKLGTVKSPANPVEVYASLASRGLLEADRAGEIAYTMFEDQYQSKWNCKHSLSVNVPDDTVFALMIKGEGGAGASPNVTIWLNDLMVQPAKNGFVEFSLPNKNIKLVDDLDQTGFKDGVMSVKIVQLTGKFSGKISTPLLDAKTITSTCP